MDSSPRKAAFDYTGKVYTTLRWSLPGKLACMNSDGVLASTIPSERSRGVESSWNLILIPSRFCSPSISGGNIKYCSIRSYQTKAFIYLFFLFSFNATHKTMRSIFFYLIKHNGSCATIVCLNIDFNCYSFDKKWPIEYEHKIK